MILKFEIAAILTGMLVAMLAEPQALAQTGGIATFSSISNELYLPEVALGTKSSDMKFFSAVTVRPRDIQVLGLSTTSSGQGANAVFDPATAELKLGGIVADGRFYFDVAVKLTSMEVRSTRDSISPDRSLPWVTEPVVSPLVSFRTFESAIVGTKVSYHVYLPKTYSSSSDRFPVLYWLHGTEGGVAGVLPVASFFDNAINAGKLPSMIIVFVNGLPRRLWADSKDGASPVESVFVKELIPQIDRVFRTIVQREGRILEGFSMGGYGAARIGFKFPELFGGISILAGGPLDLEFSGPRAIRAPALRSQLLNDVCSNDMNYFQAISPLLTAHTAVNLLRINRTVVRQLVGSLDDTRDLNFQFHNHMKSLNIPHQYVDVPNVEHDALALLQAVDDLNGNFYREALTAAQLNRRE
jgi:S-formylglutathione hydrolase FrmB